MSIATETAASYFELAARSAERGNVSEALHYAERASEILLRQPVQIEAPGTVVGESVRLA